MAKDDCPALFILVMLRICMHSKTCSVAFCGSFNLLLRLTTKSEICNVRTLHMFMHML